MKLKEILREVNVPAQCRKYGLSLWQCPQFLFLIMGLIVIVSSLIAYAIGTRYIEDPLLVAFWVLLIAVVLFVISVIITKSFERLAEANRMKSEFISIVSHQLRSPLSNLKWALELLMSGRINSVSEKQVEYFKILKENSNRMMELIKDLLIVSRIETAQLPIKKIEFSLEDLVKDLIREFAPIVRASNVMVEFEPQSDLPKIFADPSQIRLVIENFSDNAIRYIPTRQSPEADRPMAGGKEKGLVEIKIEKRNQNLYFEIKDNGVGIPKEDQKYIFQKFFRSENVLKYQTQGSGLGLYISKAIVERSGGKIGFKSQEGIGSTFWFTLPIK
jgi:signal transduction histidine kinase